MREGLIEKIVDRTNYFRGIRKEIIKKKIIYKRVSECF